MLVGAVACTATIARAADPLPSRNNGPATQFIINFVEEGTKEGTPGFVPPPSATAAFAVDEENTQIA